MRDEEALRRLVTAVVTELVGADPLVWGQADAAASPPRHTLRDPSPRVSEDPLARRAAAWLSGSAGLGEGAVATPRDRAAAVGDPPPAKPRHQGAHAPRFTVRLGSTPARLAVGRAGVRYPTSTLLRFLEDHAAARDAVTTEVEPDLLASLGLLPLSSAARDRSEFLLRPDLGRRLSPESADRVKAQARPSPQVQIVVADGLSGRAVQITAPQVLPRLVAALESAGLSVGTPVFVANGRMVVGDEVGRLVSAEVVCTLLGERPGLVTAESLGGYVTYLHPGGISEAMRSMISNIHSAGLFPEEAARQLTDLCVGAVRDRRTGVVGAS